MIWGSGGRGMMKCIRSGVVYNLACLVSAVYRGW